MPNCKEVTGQATEYAEGALDSGSRQGFEAHLATCPDCRGWVRQLDVAALALRSMPPPELPAELRDRLLGQFDAWRAGRVGGGVGATAASASPGAGRYTWEAALAMVGVVALLTGLARSPSRAAADWATALVLAAGAIAFALLIRRLTLRFAVAAVSAAFVAAAIRGGPGRLELTEGLECLAIELASAVAVAVVAWIASRRKTGAISLGSWAIAGALSGDAALQIACRAHASMAHVVTFHAGGVLVIAAVALVGSWRRPLAA